LLSGSSLSDLANFVRENESPLQPISGNQELLENTIARFIS